MSSSNNYWTRSLYDTNCNSEEPNQRIYDRYFDAGSHQNFKCIAKGEGFFSGFIPKGSIDVDSQLKNLNEHLSKCPESKKSLADHFTSVSNCDNHHDYTRLSNPLCTSREIGINRFQPVCADPQEHLSNPNILNLGMDARKFATDNYKACVAKPIDFFSCIPNGGNIRTYTTAGPILGMYPKDPLASQTIPIPPYPHGSETHYIDPTPYNSTNSMSGGNNDYSNYSNYSNVSKSYGSLF